MKSSYPIEDELIQNFNKIIEPTFDKINLLQEQNQKLTQLRDWLLPILMNGQVTVADAKEQIDELMVAEPGVGYEE